MSAKSNGSHQPEEQELMFSTDIEALIRELQRVPNGEAQLIAAKLFQKVLRFHRLGLEQLLRLAQAEFGDRFVETLANDPTIRNLLLLHGLHPTNIETRVRTALQEVEPYWRAAGYDIERLEFANGGLNLRFRKTNATEGPALALRSLIENSIINAAPDLDHLAIEGLHGDEPLSGAGFFPLTRLISVDPKDSVEKRQAAK